MERPRVRPVPHEACQTRAQAVAARLPLIAGSLAVAFHDRILRLGSTPPLDPDSSARTLAPWPKRKHRWIPRTLDGPSHGDVLSCQGLRCRAEVTYSNRTRSYRGGGRGTVRGTVRWIISGQRVPSVRCRVSFVQLPGMGARSRASHNPPVVGSSPTRPTRNLRAPRGWRGMVRGMNRPPGVRYRHATGRQRSRRATTQRVVPRGRVRRRRPADPASGLPQGHHQDIKAGAG